MPEAFQTRVQLANSAYTIFTGDGLIDQIADMLSGAGLPPGRCAVISDSNVAPLYAARLQAALGTHYPADFLTVPAGESSKSMQQATALCRELVRMGHDRKSFVIALGGGVVGDLAGFVASLFLRGIPIVQVPTTIVSQVDSAIGGKTGVNLPEGKNLVGAFLQPAVVVSDVSTLESLPPREYHEGFAEIIKHAIIRDATLFEDLFNFSRMDLARVIARNAEIKATIVMADERETTGERALLNFGHTIGHAIENAAGYGRLLHGEAIALGIVAASRLSMQHAGLSPESFHRIIQLLQRFELPCQIGDIPTGPVLDAMKVDKKFERGRIRFVLTGAIGSAFVSGAVSTHEIADAVARLTGDPLE